MLFDHIGYVLLSGAVAPLVSGVGNTAGFISADIIGKLLILTHYGFRFIGRLSFPIFCFLLAEGVYHTRNRLKYFLRMAIFAFVSEIPFDLALYGKWFYMGKQNVFFTLTAGVAVISVIGWLNKKAQTRAVKVISVILSFIVVAVAYYGLNKLHTDYMGKGMLLMVFLYLFKNVPVMQCLSGGFLLNDKRSLFAFIPIYFYNGERGKCPKLLKYGFYLFYPVHLLVLAGISFLIG